MPTPVVVQNSIEKVHDVTAESIAPGTRSVLILEDEVALCEILRTYLEGYSFRVTCVTNGVDGLREILTADFDIILCDLVMPNLPGDKFYLAVEHSRKHLCKRFVFMTGHKTNSNWSGFLSKVPGPILGKPFSLADLLSAIQTVMTENALAEPKPAQ